MPTIIEHRAHHDPVGFGLMKTGNDLDGNADAIGNGYVINIDKTDSICIAAQQFYINENLFPTYIPCLRSPKQAM